MEWTLFWQILLLMLVFWLVVTGIIKTYFESVAMCEVVVGKQLDEHAKERETLFRGSSDS